jgi:RNA polymerase sigma-70 factor (ECF subfamily)
VCVPAPALAPEIRGRDAGRARAAPLALVEGDSGLVFAPGGQPRVVVDFVLENGRIVEINMIADAERIAALDLEF